MNNATCNTCRYRNRCPEFSRQYPCMDSIKYQIKKEGKANEVRSRSKNL